MHTSSPDVVVLGAGPVGQTAALLLARWGLQVVLLDQRSGRDHVGSKAICQQRDVLDIWESVGVGRRIADEGVTWTTARTFYRDNELLATTFVDPGRSPFPPWINVSQATTEALLDEAIAESPLVDLRWGHHVTDIWQDASGVTVTCATMSGPVIVRAPYAVACAGARGDAIRRMLGVNFDGTSFNDHFLICDIRADLPGWANERRFYFDPVWNPGRQVLIHPCPDSVFRIDWQVTADFDLDRERSTGALDARIRQIVGDGPFELLWQSVYRFSSRCVDRMRAGRVLLAGDLAHLVAPFGARGLNSGVQDVENAAWKLAFVTRGWSPPSLLDSYHTERVAAAMENLDVTNATMRFLVPQNDEEWATRRDVLTRAITDPDARANVDSGRLAEPFWYVDSPLTTSDPDRPFAGRPPMGHTPRPAPGIMVPDAPISVPELPAVTRLRELVRDGLLALTSGDVDSTAVAVELKETVSAPVRVLRLEDIDPSSVVRDALRARPGEVWLIRPDGYVAAVPTFGEAGALARAAARAIGVCPGPDTT